MQAARRADWNGAGGEIILSEAAYRAVWLGIHRGRAPFTLPWSLTMKSRLSFVFVALVCFACGWIAAQFGPAAAFAQPASEAVKGATFSHALVIKVRKSDEAEFTGDTKRFGVEVLRDENNGNLIYISETGSISVVKP
jgi:hypothetical protein